ncbi:response regulator transcription factor [Brachybacterium huguangmaarense]|uniref:Response regulator transcription factor n=1 Tax=Brachybacterium huguangmaarense TaxID=1652028 RepID=A0ABY6G213_9MICO|nr:response regulator transcription factor [Brachybacterium huguangmaarense]UYG17100.1 response regulator transcription factor [Brachybacterium huguangmaarense]
MTAAPIRVLVAEDHAAVRAGLVTLLDSAADIVVVAEAADGPAALEAARAHRPDVVLTDVRMPRATGIDITPSLRALGASVLVISGFDLDDHVLGALAAGADGYLVKSEEPERILAAVRAVHRGDAVLSASATRTVVAALRTRPEPAAAPAPDFTRREEEVLALVARGLSNQQIARELFVEVTTVKSHLSHALAKLGLDSRVQAALWWQRHRG